MQPAIRVEGLSKQYRLGKQQAAYRTLQEALVQAAATPARWVRRLAHRAQRAPADNSVLWALKDVSFEVRPGEVVGLIGRNGAGKSTLLKVLSRIVEPSSGRATLRGRIASLLEVGTGFHQELTGRENIYLNGSILGMTRREIGRKFDEIVAFSEVERFLDTPVKRYSSGMYVRLAFAVAAHLDPEILIVDEVLAVGDAGFQKKCLGRMQEVSREGRTILFVSHNMAAIRSLCERAVVLGGGRVEFDGGVGEGIEHYTRSFGTVSMGRDLAEDSHHRSGRGTARFQHVAILSSHREPISHLPLGEGVIVRMGVRAKQPTKAKFIVNIVDGKGVWVCNLNSLTMENRFVEIPAGPGVTVECNVPWLNLMPETYSFCLTVTDADDEILDYAPYTVSVEIVQADVYGTGRIPWRDTLVYYPGRWELTWDPMTAPDDSSKTRNQGD